MKKFIVLSVVLASFAALAQVVSNQFVSAPSVAVSVPFNLHAFLQQVMVNGGFVLLAFLCSKIPVVGPYIQKVIDVLVGNPKHP